jgi:hypothetical protein
MEVGDIKVKSYTINELTITWKIEIDPEENIMDYEISIFRSGSPEGEFEELANNLFDVYVFIDKDISTQSKLRKFYYKVKLTNTNTNQEVTSNPVSSCIATDMTLIGLELARRNTLLLKRFVGIPCTVFIQRRWGPRCPECWDHNKKQVRRSNCLSCYRVGRYKGYYNPIYNIYFQISQHGQSIDHANIGAMEPSQTNAWTSNYPLITAGDIIVEPGNKRWRVSAVSTTEQLRVPVRQMLQLHYIDPGNIEYLLEMPDA